MSAAITLVRRRDGGGYITTDRRWIVQRDAEPRWWRVADSHGHAPVGLVPSLAHVITFIRDAIHDAEANE